MCAPIVISTEFFCRKNGEANGEAKFHASVGLWLVFLVYNVYYYYRHQIALYPKHQLRRKLNILLKGSIFYSAIQIPLSFVLNSDRWIDYVFIISLNLCFSIFYIKYFRYTCMLGVNLTGTYTFLICFAMGISIQVAQLFESIENEGRTAAF
uniref:Transmembrane domain-containing protein n=1 Tax=Caenorhabditis tropicalis TaxID=1561998 RepID=A0A1I7TUG5_9PELO